MEYAWLAGVAVVVTAFAKASPQIRETVDWWDGRQDRKRRSKLARKRRAKALNAKSPRRRSGAS